VIGGDARCCVCTWGADIILGGGDARETQGRRKGDAKFCVSTWGWLLVLV
jgi:hypothetical protein